MSWMLSLLPNSEDGERAGTEVDHADALASLKPDKWRTKIARRAARGMTLSRSWQVINWSVDFFSALCSCPRCGNDKLTNVRSAAMLVC
jgi:hypothetical protein